MENEDSRLAAPYHPFRTLLNALDHLTAIGVPHKIEERVFPSFSGSMQKQLINSFRFLGLIDAVGAPTQNLLTLADKGKDRKAVLKDILLEQYSELVSLDLTKVSPSQFDDQLKEYGVNGATLRKAKSFFLKAAQYSGIALSPLLTRTTRNRNNGPRRRKTSIETKVVKPPLDVKPPTGTSKQVTLACGGELTLQLSVNLFELQGKDRDFVFGLIDEIQKYEYREMSYRGLAEFGIRGAAGASLQDAL